MLKILLKQKTQRDMLDSLEKISIFDSTSLVKQDQSTLLS